MFDILCTAHDIASTLSHQITLFMMSHPLNASHHTPLSDIAPTVSLSMTITHKIARAFKSAGDPKKILVSVYYLQ